MRSYALLSEKSSGRTQPEARGNLYVALMNTYIDTKDYDKAGEYLSKLESIVNNNISKYELARAKALIFQSQGDYRKALAVIDSATAGIDESDFSLNDTRKIKMEILARMGRVDEALALLDQFIATNDTIKNVEVNARFDELRTQYEVEKHIAGKERNFHYLLFALAICLVLALLLAGAFYYNRTIALKNRKLYERIKEQDRLADELSRLENIRQSESSPEDSGKTAGATEQKIHDQAKQMAVYAYDSRKITDQDFHLGYSTFSGKEDEIDLVAAYRISSQMPVFSFGKPQIIQRGFVRAWSGRDFRKELQKEGNKESKEKVFVTAHGTVYHKSLKCTHLRLSVEQTTVTQAEARRNRYGAKYYACSCCKSGVGAAVYITDTGNRYHARLSCSGLKRTIREIPLSEAGKRKACSKCGG